MKAILLAAGEGTRLTPITETRAKSMVPILCKPLIDWHVEALLNSGMEEVIIVIGYMKEQVIDYFKRKPHYRERLKFVEQPKPMGTGDAVLKALDATGSGEEVIIAYADLFLENWSVYGELARLDGYYVVGGYSPNPRDYGVLHLNGSYLSKIIEKPQQPVSDVINVGIYKLNTTDILENQDIPLSPRGELEFTDIVSKIASKKPVKVYMYQNSWVDVGKPWQVIEANKIALKNIKHEIRGNIVQPVHIEPPVYIDRETIVNPFTVIKGPAYIGKSVELGPNAYIRPWSVICDGSRIGFSVEVKESVIFENVHASHLAYIGDSVVCEHANIGAGVKLANLRFDRKTVKMKVKDNVEDTGRQKLGAIIGGHAQLGVNVSVVPGVKIGSYSWVLPGTTVYRDIPSNTIYPSKSSI